MSRLARRVGLGVAIGVALLAALAAAAPYLVDLPRVQVLAAASAGQVLGRPVRFASVSVHLLPTPRVEMRGLEVAEDPRFGTAPFATLQRGVLSLRVRSLLAGRLEFGELRLDGPTIRLVEGADGTINVASLGVVRESGARQSSGGARSDPQVRGGVGEVSLIAGGIAIERGTLIVVSRHPGLREYRLVDLDLRLRNDGASLSVAGRGRLVPGDAAISIVDGRISLSGIRSPGDAPVSGEVRVDVPDLRPLTITLTPPEMSLSGEFHATATLSGRLGALQAVGDVRLARAAVTGMRTECRPPSRTLAIEEVGMPGRWTGRNLLGRPLAVRVAGGQVSAQLTASIDRDLRVALSDIAVRDVEVERVLGEFLCHGYAVSGPLVLTGGLAFRVPGVLGSLSGDGKFGIGRGRVIGTRVLDLFRDVVKTAELAALASGEELASPFEFQSITGSYRLRDGVATTRDLVYTGHDFTATAAGEYALTSGALDVDLLVRHRREQFRARVTGTAQMPVLRVDAVRSLGAVDHRQIERGLRGVLRRFR